jgi:phosphate starvation-inducible PhoH-like protein
MSNSKSISTKSTFLKNAVTIRDKIALTEKQKEILDVCVDDSSKIIFLDGPAGTSKTYLAVLASLVLLNTKKVTRIVYYRNPIESSLGKIGSLPGEKEDKLNPYACPLNDKLKELLTDTSYAKIVSQDQRVEMEHIGFARGQNWRYTAAIADEAQNLTKEDLLLLMTRLSEGSKLFILGDSMQSDIGNKSGYAEVVDLFSDISDQHHGIYSFQFGNEDVVRSEIVKYVIEKFQDAYSE